MSSGPGTPGASGPGAPGAPDAAGASGADLALGPTARADGTVVRAAGGVVWRQGGEGVEVLLIHRPRYDDWSLPKGKAEPNEDDAVTAHREVAEETGLDCVLGPELARIRYTDHNGRAKVVRYWAMTLKAGSAEDFVANREVDHVAWLSVDEAAQRLSYDRDRPVLDALLDTL